MQRFTLTNPDRKAVGFLLVHDDGIVRNCSFSRIPLRVLVHVLKLASDPAIPSPYRWLDSASSASYTLHREHVDE